MFTKIHYVSSEKQYLILLFFVCLIWFTEAFWNFHPSVGPDWDECLTHQELQRKIVTQYHQFPLWNPYVCGGEPWFAHPESSFLSLHFIFVIIFGTFKGVILSILVLTLTGIIGMYLLSRFFGLAPAFSLISSLFFLSLFNPLVYFNPFPCFYIALCPWIYLAFIYYKRNHKFPVVIPILFAYLIYAGAYYALIFTFLMLLIDASWEALSKRDTSIFFAFFKMIALAFLMASPKLIPMIELLLRYPRIETLPDYHGWFLDLSRIGGLGYIYTLKNVMSTTILSTILVFFLFSFLLFKSYPQLILMNLFFSLLFQGDYSPLNIWRVWHFFMPSFRRHHAIFLMALLVPLSLCAGLLMSRASMVLRKSRLVTYLSLFLLVFFLLYNIFNDARGIFQKKPVLDYDLSGQRMDFYQTEGSPTKMFDTVFNNRGAVNGFDTVGRQIKTRVLPREDARYRGECYLERGFGQITNYFFTPNVLKINLRMHKGDLLVVNQNYFSGWRSSVGNIINRNGLLAVPLRKSNTSISLYYFPRSLIFGVIVLIVFLISLCHKQMRARLLK